VFGFSSRGSIEGEEEVNPLRVDKERLEKELWPRPRPLVRPHERRPTWRNTDA
jgi:hypothetical protein